MKGDIKVIEWLNKILGNELIAINQYMLHSRIFKEWGFSALADKVYSESIDEMKHADMLVQRILFLKGLPNLQDLGKLNIGEEPREMISSDLNLERIAIKDLKEAIACCENAKDYASRDMLNGILDNEEEHVEWLDRQLGVMDKIGMENYLQSML